MLDPDQQFEPRMSSRQLPDGKIVSVPLEDMYPFLEREELFENLLLNRSAKATDIVRFNNFIFDLDGTLVNSTGGIQAAFEYSWKSLFSEESVPDIRQFIGPPIKEIIQTMRPTASENELNRLVSSFREAYDLWGWQMTILYNDVAPFLELL